MEILCERSLLLLGVTGRCAAKVLHSSPTFNLIQVFKSTEVIETILQKHSNSVVVLKLYAVKVATLLLNYCYCYHVLVKCFSPKLSRNKNVYKTSLRCSNLWYKITLRKQPVECQKFYDTDHHANLQAFMFNILLSRWTHY